MKKLFFTFLLSMVVASFAYADTIVSKSGRQYWHSKSAWEGGVIPGENDRVIIRGNVSSHHTRTIRELVVETGGVLQLSGSNLTVSEEVVNDGLITDGKLIPEGNVQSRGSIGSVVSWRGGAEKQFLLAQDSMIGLYLESNITISNNFTIKDFRPGGKTVYAQNSPTLFLGYLQQDINIQGEAIIHAVYRSAKLSYRIVAPDSIVHIQPSTIHSEYISVKELIFQSGYYPSYSNLKVRAPRTTLLPGAYLDMSRGSLEFVGDIHNLGFFNNSRNVVKIQGSIYNEGGWQTFRGPYLVPFEETYPTIQYLQAGNLYGLQNAEVRNTGSIYDLRNLITGKTQAYLSFRGIDAEGKFTSWNDPYTINIPFSTTTDADKYVRKSNVFFSYMGARETRSEFLIQIDFEDKETNGVFNLYTSRGRISPRLVEVKDGVWFGEVILYEAGEHTNLFINNAKYYGKSNDFRVTDGEFVVNGGLRGKVYEQSLESKPEKEDQVVFLYDEAKRQNLVATTTTNGSGIYNFTNIPCGKYYISADSPGIVSPTESEVEVPCGGVTMHDLAFTKCSESSKTPVLLVPGIMGSDKVGNGSVYPELYKDLPYWSSEKLKIHDVLDIDVLDTSVMGWENLRESFEEEGYVRGCDVFDVPYEWSLSVLNIASLYLKPWVNHAKERSGKEKVNIVAHSMGGLVARAYIQGDEYEKDVQQLVMVGTPNQGSTNSYFLWEGGDPIAADESQTSGFFGKRIGEYFYTNTISENQKIKTEDESACVFYGDNIISGIGRSVINDKPFSCDRERIKNFLEEKAASVGQLFPTYEFLLGSGAGYLEPNYENKFLKALNNQECNDGCGYSFATTTDVFGDDDGQVQVSLLAGTEQSTVQNILLSRNKKGSYLYTDGSVTYYNYSMGGDGTVLEDSVLVGLVSLTDKVNSSHSTLMGSFISRIINIIN